MIVNRVVEVVSTAPAGSRISKIERRAYVQQWLSGQHRHFCSLTVSLSHRLTVCDNEHLESVLRRSGLSLPCLALVAIVSAMGPPQTLASEINRFGAY
jgi:hypothetical protein